MHVRLRRPAVALIASTLAAGVLAVAPVHAAVAGTVSGTVTAPGGAPLESVQVELLTYDSQVDGWRQTNTAPTDATGAYSFSAPAVPFRIGFLPSDDAYAPEYYDNATTVGAARTVTVPEAGELVANAELAPAATISGVLTGPDGQPANAQVVVLQAPSGSSTFFPFFPGFEPVTNVSVTTDETGAYTVPGLPAGSYRIGFMVEPNGPISLLPAIEWYADQPSPYSAQDLTVSAGQALSGINATLEAPAMIEGTITDRVGQPMTNTLVTVLAKVGQDWKTVNVGQTNFVDGTYAVPVKGGATYRVRFDTFTGFGPFSGASATEYWQDKGLVSNATSIPVAPGQVVTGIDAQMIPGEHAAEQKRMMTNTAIPTITGTPVVGATLTALPGTYTPAPSAYAFQWTRDNQPIAGAVGATYTPTSADLGAAIAVVVTASVDDFDPAIARSRGTDRVVAAPVPPTVRDQLEQVLAGVKVKGALKVGRTVKLKGLDASFRATVKYRIQWYAGSKKINKATKSKLRITSALRGKKISVKVTATASGTKATRKLILGKAR
jgi:hypothetical protein